MANQPPSTAIRFGPFEADLQAGQLRKNGLKLKIQEMPMRVLACLLERPGEVVTREELRQKLWAEDEFVEFEHSLNTAVNKLRSALGDHADHPRYIETIPRRGYRFIHTVQRRSQGKKGRRLPWPVAAVATALIVIAGVTWYLVRPPPKTTVLHPEPLTVDRRVEECATFSPDGTQVAYEWVDEEGAARPYPKLSDIYIKQIGVENPRRFTEHPAPEFSPAWSPDGRWIAFLRELTGARAEIMLKAPAEASGGPERKLTEIHRPGWTALVGPYLAWGPESKSPVIMDRASPEEPHSLYLLSVDPVERHRLTTPPPDIRGDYCPAVSPDGRKLVFSRVLSWVPGDLYLLELSDDLRGKGEPRQITFTGNYNRSAAWTPDGDDVVFSSGEGTGTGLWRLAVPGSGEARRLTTSGRNLYPAISRQSGRLAYMDFHWNSDIWRVDVTETGSPAGPSAPFIDSNSLDGYPVYSPNGVRIAFMSERSGNPEIWLCDGEGSNLMKLTSVRAWATPHSWSPDGERIAFSSTFDGNREIYTISVNGGSPRRLTDHITEDQTPIWSRDGLWIYFTSNRGGEDETWKMPAAGGEPLRVSERIVAESPDGEFLYFTRTEGDVTSA